MGELREIIRSNLERYISASEYTQKEIAEKLGVSKSSITNWIKGKNSPDVELVVPICKLLNITIREFYGEPDTIQGPPYLSSEQSQNIPPYSNETMKLAEDYDRLDNHGKRVVRLVTDEEKARCAVEKNARVSKTAIQQEQMEAVREVSSEFYKVIDLPFDELKASAGVGYQLDEDRLTIWKVRLNELTRKADFCLEVDGHSMEPMIKEGDIILVRQQPAVDIGEIGLFTVNDKGYVKKQGKDRLISINPKSEDVFPNEYDTVFCRGKVIGVLEPEWIVER